MNNNINVRSSGDGVGVEGLIVAQSGMPVKFHNTPDNSDLVVQSVTSDVVTATGVGNIEFKDYAFYTHITETNAATYGWPTGTNCIVFGHAGVDTDHSL